MSDPVELDSLQRSPLSNEVLDTLGVRTGVLDTAADQAARDDPGVRALLSDVMQSGPATAEDQADLAAGISAAPDSEKARSVGLRGLTPPAAAPDGSPLLRDKDIANLILQATTPSGGGGARRVTTDTLEQTLPARVPPELRSQIDKRRERLETAQEEVTRKAQQIAETAAAVHRGQAKIIDDVRAEAAERNAALEERHAELREDIEEAGVKYNALKEEAARETDPGRLWNNMSTGSKILASIASALGGVNAAITGGENMVMRQLQTAIDRDIQAQESNRRAAERRAGDILNYQQALRGIMGDDLAAAEAKRAMGWEQAQRAIDALTQQGASEETLQRASLLKAQMAEKQAAAELAAVNAMAGSIHRKVVTKRAQGRGRGVARAAEKRLELINKFPQLFERREVSPENTPVIPGSRLVDPRRGLTTTERRQGAEIYGNAVQALSDLREYQDSLDSASLRERKDAQDQIIEGLSDSEPGILTPFASLARNIVDPDAKRVVRNAYTVARGVALTQNPGGRISDNDVLQGFMQLVQATERGAVQTIDKVANRWKRDAQSRLRSLNQQVPEDAFDSFATSGTEKVK